MRNLKALAAILAALFFGAVAATILAGCQPAKPKIKSIGTTGTTTDASRDDAAPKAEIKDEVPPEGKADEKATEDKPAEDKPAAIPKGETPTDGNPAGVQPADEKPAAKDVDGKSGEKAAVLPKGETPTDANPAGVKP